MSQSVSLGGRQTVLLRWLREKIAGGYLRVGSASRVAHMQVGQWGSVRVLVFCVLKK
jgi:hypothetical protein